jgi:Ca2+-binding RTX toxin-like protein
LSGFEALEPRDVKTAVLDFDGEFISARQMRESQWPNQSTTQASFNTLFNATHPFLDIDSNGQVNATDANLARDRIVQTVRNHFAPYNLEIIVGDQDDHQDLLTDRRPGDVIVIVSGGPDNFDNDGSYGVGHVDHCDNDNTARCNDDDEIVFAFGREIADKYASAGDSTANRFINHVARTISHEMGHSFGLEHAIGPNGDPLSHSIMAAPSNGNDPRDFSNYFNFPDRSFEVKGDIEKQNAHQYLTDTLGDSARPWTAVLKPGELTVEGNVVDNALTVRRNSNGTWAVNVSASFFGHSISASYLVDPDNSPNIRSINPFDTAISKIVMRGGSGNDELRVDSRINVSPYAYGGRGDDLLRGGSGADHLYGQDGADILVGRGGDDELWGDSPLQGYQRDILIGGEGRDILRGGSEDDLMIAGRTSHDDSLAALRRLMAEWNSDSDYRTRVGHLSGSLSGGRNGRTLLNSRTVFDDGVVDRLYGGTGQDRFHAESNDVTDEFEVRT